MSKTIERILVLKYDYLPLNKLHSIDLVLLLILCCLF